MSVMAVAVVVIRGGANFGFIRFYFLDKDPEYRRRLIRTVFWAQMAYSTLGARPLRRLRAGDRQRARRRLPPASQALRAAARASSSRRRSCSGSNVNYAQMTNLFRAEQRSVAFSIATLANIAHHRPAHGDPRRRLQGGPARDHRRQPQRHAASCSSRCSATAASSSASSSTGKLLRTVNRFGVPLMAAALAMWVTNFGDRLHAQQAPARHVPAHPARAVLARQQDQLGDGAPLHRLPDRVARVRVLDRGRGRGEARLLLRPHVPDVRRRLGGGRR